MARRMLALALLLPALAFAGKKDKVDPDHANHYRAVAPTGEDVKIGIEDAWARDAQAKMKVTVVNDSADYVLFKAAETALDFAGQTFTPKAGLRGKFLIVQPKDRGSRVLTADGIGMHQPSMTFVPNGVYLVPKNAPPQKADDLQVPLDRSSVKAGNFSCAVPGKIKQETDETAIRFKCRYEGEGIGIVDPASLQIRLEDGQKFVNDDRGMKPKIVQPGDEFKFDAVFHISARIIDMQFATMHIVFNETFREGQTRKVELKPMVLELDPGMTAAKN